MTDLLKRLLLSVFLLAFALPPAVAEKNATETLLMKGFGHLKKGNYALAIPHLRGVIDSTAASDDMKARAQISLGRCYLKKEEYGKALKEFAAVPVDFPAAGRHLHAESFLEVAEALGMLQKPDKAIDASETVLRRYGDVPKELLWKACASKAHFLNASDQPEKSLKAYRECLQYHENLPRWYAVQGFLRYANQLKVLGEEERAARYYFRVLNEYEDYWNSWGRTCLTAIIDCTASEELLKKTMERCTEVICASPETRGVAQESIVKILLKLKDYKRALSHAKMYFDICSFDQMRNGLDYLIESSNGVDGDSARAERLLHYLRFGTKGFDRIEGTSDDVKDPLQHIEYVKETDREKKILSVIKKTPKDTDGSLTRSELYLLLNDRDSALKELRSAYRACQGEEDQLQKVADRIAELLFLGRGDIEAEEHFVRSLQFGQNEEGGAAKTTSAKERKDACLFEVAHDSMSRLGFQRDLSKRLARIYFAETDELIAAGCNESAREKLLQVLIAVPEKAVRRETAERVFATFDAASPRESPRSVFAARSWVHLKQDKRIGELIDYYGALYLYRQRQFEDAKKLINEVLPSYRGTENEVDFEFLKALCHVKMGNYALGEKELLHIIRSYPEFGDRMKARFLFGWIAMMDEEYSKAREIFESIAKDSSGDVYGEHAKDFLSRIPGPI